MVVVSLLEWSFQFIYLYIYINPNGKYQVRELNLFFK